MFSVYKRLLRSIMSGKWMIITQEEHHCPLSHFYSLVMHLF